MSYFIFLPNLNNVEGTLYRIAENESDLNNLNINKVDYKIIEDNQLNFDNVKYGLKYVENYINDIITYKDNITIFEKKEVLDSCVKKFKKQIKNFTDSNKSHALFNKWENYYIQLSSLDLDTITYPLNKSLEQYFKDLGQPSLNILQIP
jgi:hypothetical protein